MKKLGLLTLALTLVFTSCKKDALDTTFSTDLSAISSKVEVNNSPVVDVRQRGLTSANYSTKFVLDLNNSDAKKYLNKLKKIDLSDLRLVLEGLKDLVGNRTPTIFAITIDDKITYSIGGFSYGKYAQGDPIMIRDNAKIAQISKLLLENKKITIKVTGRIPSKKHFSFKIKLMAKAKITAGL